MIVDVLISSCARPDILDVSFRTFRERIKTKHEFRYVLLEDKVNDAKRQAKGKRWIDKNIHLLDKIVYADDKLGPGYFFGPVVALCKSDFFFHLEDDNDLVLDVDIDPIIEFMSTQDDVVEVILNRGKSKHSLECKKIEMHGLKLTEFDLFSVATGVFNTKLVKQMIDKAGWHNQLHEAGLMTPLAKEMNFNRYVLGHGEVHYVHVGEKKGYRKGAWRK